MVREDAAASELRMKIQELQSVVRENELMKSELQRVRAALNKARGQQAQIQLEVEKKQLDSFSAPPLHVAADLSLTTPNLSAQAADAPPPAGYLDMPPELCGTAPNLLAQARMAQDPRLSATVCLRPP